MMEIENTKQQGRTLNSKNTKSQKWSTPSKDKKH